ncbi:ABC transporter permease [Lentisphaerota bacterium ZTH]|nr:ABC transporter permease [Lentisphaerota bacterium]WET06452.1 ABC transporter permease [Lentisphaerota bacterium ZTH]
MFEYIIKRLLLAVITLFVIMALSYFLLRLTPGDPTRSAVIGGDSPGSNLSSEKGEFAENTSLRKRLYLDKPIYIGFYFWLKGVITDGDFGASASIDPGRPVTDIILERLPVTVKLNFWSVLVIYLFAIPLGIYSAIYPDTKFDRGITFFLFFLYSLPVIWVALLLQASFCEGGWLSLFPLKGLRPANPESMTTWQILWHTALHYVMPVICLSYAGFAGISRFARSSMLDVVNQDYIRTARAKGLPEHVVILKHALRNGLITLITLFAGLLPGLVAGSIITEYVFSIPGMGSLSLLSLSSRDYPVQMALFCFGGALTLGGILLSDILYVIVDPRISFSNRE